MQFLLSIIVLASVLFPIAWLVSEFRGSRPVRIGLGIFALIAVGSVSHFVAQMTPSYERHFYAVAFHQAEGLLADGDTNAVLRAIRAHNTALRTGTVYHAAQTFMSAFSVGNRETK